jgi:signal transduction histidine kinase
MARRLQAALRSQRDLLHAVSHELRSPLQRIRFALDLLPYAKTPEDLGRRVGELQGDVDELDALVDELLTWSRVENGETSLQRVDVDVASVLDGVADAARRLRPEVEVRLEVLPLTASLDDSGFRRAVTNLVNNAVRYTDTRVVVSATLAGDRLTVQVDDDGDGVPEADRERIFEPFVRLDAARSRDTGGVGLGLAIVSRLAGDHGGAVHVEPSPLGGARFVWTARV